MKKVTKILLTFFLLIIFVNKLNATSEPTFDEAKKVLYANGTKIDIYEVAHDVTELTLDSTLQTAIGNICGNSSNEVCTTSNADAVVIYGFKYVYISKDTSIFGGAKESSVSTTDVSLNSGTVKDIFGGGKGTTTIAANVDTAIITVKGGTAWSVNGGGYLKSTVKNTTINMNGGIVGNIQGGGYEQGQNYISDGGETVGTEAHPELSTNIVENATLNLTGGRTYDADAGWGLIAGGGLGYAYVKNTTVNVSGSFGNPDEDHDLTYLIAGGANGRTDKSIINISGGNLYTVQSVNRGSIGEAKINITGGTIDYVYAGGETSDSSVTGVVEKVYLTLSGGTITSLRMGTDGGTVIPTSSEKVYVAVSEEATITNEDSLETEFGVTLAPLVGGNVIGGVETLPVIIDKDALNTIKDTEFTMLFYKLNEEGYLEYGWEFEGRNITDPTIAVDTEILITTTAPEAVKTDIEKLIPTDSKVLYLNFTHDGALPGKAKVGIVLDSEKYNAGDKLYIAHYNETTKKFENTQEVTVSETESGYLVITFEITGCSVYTVTTANLVPNPKTADAINIYILITLISFMGISSLVARKQKNF